MSFIILILWLVFSIAMAVRAKRRNRSPTGWFVLSLLFTPLVTFCALDLLSPYRPPRLITLRTIESRKRQGRNAFVGSVTMVVMLVVLAFAKAAP